MGKAWGGGTRTATTCQRYVVTRRSTTETVPLPIWTRNTWGAAKGQNHEACNISIVTGYDVSYAILRWLLVVDSVGIYCVERVNPARRGRVNPARRGGPLLFWDISHLHCNEMPCWPVPASAQLSTPIHTHKASQKYDHLTKMFFHSTNMKLHDSMVQLQLKHNWMQMLGIKGWDSAQVRYDWYEHICQMWESRDHSKGCLCVSTIGCFIINMFNIPSLYVYICYW